VLTGDNRTTAQAVAGKLGITDIEAEVLPEQKNAIVLGRDEPQIRRALDSPAGLPTRQIYVRVQHREGVLVTRCSRTKQNWPGTNDGAEIRIRLVIIF
jgi:hypothetical protein